MAYCKLGFRARRFIRRNLTLFKIPNKSFVLLAFISKNRHEQDSKKIFSCFVFNERLRLFLCLTSF